MWILFEMTYFSYAWRYYVGKSKQMLGKLNDHAKCNNVAEMQEMSKHSNRVDAKGMILGPMG